MPLTAIVLAAGEGTRMKSRHPKVMHTLLDRPLVGWAVDAARRAGCDRIIVVVGHGGQEVRDYLSNFDDVEFVEQPQQLGTGHAVRCVFEALYPNRNAFAAMAVLLFCTEIHPSYVQKLFLGLLLSPLSAMTAVPYLL